MTKLGVDPLEGGSANNYDYCSGDPINCTDLAGTWGLSNIKKWAKDHWKQVAAGVVIGAVGCLSVAGCALAVIEATGTASLFAGALQLEVGPSLGVLRATLSTAGNA